MARGRRLLTPDEVLRLPREQELLFLRGHAAVRAQRLDYRTDATLSTLADKNPMHSSVHTTVLASASPCTAAESDEAECMDEESVSEERAA